VSAGLARPASLAFALLGAGCISGLTQVAGTGALYYTRCSADMSLEGAVYRAQCTPEDCTLGFAAGPVNHVVVALDPGRKVIGYAERVCVQDLSRASGLFDPTLLSAEPLSPATPTPPP
jgi:hypothetical protein